MTKRSKSMTDKEYIKALERNIEIADSLRKRSDKEWTKCEARLKKEKAQRAAAEKDRDWHKAWSDKNDSLAEIATRCTEAVAKQLAAALAREKALQFEICERKDRPNQGETDCEYAKSRDFKCYDEDPPC